MNTNLGTECEFVCLFHELNMFLLREKVICMSVKMAIPTKKTAFCVFQFIQVLGTVNRKKGPLFNHGAMNLQTTCIMCVQYI